MQTMSAVGVAEGDGLTVLDPAALHASHADPADKVVRVDIGDQDLQAAVKVTLGSGDLIDDRLKERLHVGAALVVVVGGVAIACGGIDDGEIKLFFVGSQLDEQIEHLVHDLLGSGSRTVDLVEDDQRLFAECQRLFEHKARLRHAALKRIDQQHDAVNKLQNTLHLAAEVGVSGRVYDVDFDIVVHNGGGL